MLALSISLADTSLSPSHSLHLPGFGAAHGRSGGNATLRVSLTRAPVSPAPDALVSVKWVFGIFFFFKRSLKGFRHKERSVPPADLSSTNRQNGSYVRMNYVKRYINTYSSTVCPGAHQY